MPYKAKRKFKLKAYKRHSSRSRSRKRSAPRAGLIARVGVTSDRKTITLVRTYYLNMNITGTGPGYTVDGFFDPLVAWKASPYFNNYINEYSYCLPMQFTTELTPVCTQFPAGAYVWSAGPLEISQTSDYKNPTNYLQTAKSVMILPENNMLKKWHKTWQFQRTQMEYANDGIKTAKELFGCLQMFQASQCATLPAFTFKTGPIGMFKVSIKVCYWDERGAAGAPGRPGNPYFVPWTSNVQRLEGLFDYPEDADSLFKYELPTEIHHPMYKCLIPMEVPLRHHEAFHQYRNAVRLERGLRSDYPKGFIDPSYIHKDMNTGDPLLPSNLGVYNTSQFQPDPDPLKRKWRGTPEQLEALRNERDAMGMNQRGRDKVQKMCEEFDELG